jgi:hypothetical protein
MDSFVGKGIRFNDPAPSDVAEYPSAALRVQGEVASRTAVMGRRPVTVAGGTSSSSSPSVAADPAAADRAASACPAEAP